MVLTCQRIRKFDDRIKSGTDLCAAAVQDECRVNSRTGLLGQLGVLVDIDFAEMYVAVYLRELRECRKDSLKSSSDDARTFSDGHCGSTDLGGPTPWCMVVDDANVGLADLEGQQVNKGVILGQN